MFPINSIPAYKAICYSNGGDSVQQQIPRPYMGEFLPGLKDGTTKLPEEYRNIYPNGLPTVIDMDGLKLIVDELPNSTTTAIKIFVNVGSLSDNSVPNPGGRSLGGLAHVVEHTHFLGTRKRPSTYDIMNDGDKINAKLTAFTMPTCTVYFASVPSKNTLGALDLLSDVLFNSKFDYSLYGEIKDEIELMKNELTRHFYTPVAPERHLKHSLYSEIWKGHPMVSGEDHIKSIGNIDFEHIAHFMYSFYTLENTIISVAGNCKADEIADKIKSEISKIRAKGLKQELTHFKYNPAILPIDFPESALAYTVLLTEGPSFKDGVEPYNASLLTKALGNTLRQNRSTMRDTGYMTQAVYNTDHFGLVGSEQSFHLAPDRKNLKKALDTLMSIIKSSKDGAFSNEEINTAKQNTISDLELAYGSSEARVAYNAISMLTSGRVIPLFEHFEALSQAKPADIVNIANKMFDSKKMSLGLLANKLPPVDVIREIIQV